MRISDWSSDVCSSDLPPPLDVSGEEHFEVVRDQPAVRGVHVGAPAYSERLASWIVMVGLRIETAGGAFDGVADGIVDPEYFARVFESATLVESAVFTLFRLDGALLARRTNDPSLRGPSPAERPFLTTTDQGPPHGTVPSA